jgi:hypothetical protein
MSFPDIGSSGIDCSWLVSTVLVVASMSATASAQTSGAADEQPVPAGGIVGYGTLGATVIGLGVGAIACGVDEEFGEPRSCYVHGGPAALGYFIVWPGVSAGVGLAMSVVVADAYYWAASTRLGPGWYWAMAIGGLATLIGGAIATWYGFEDAGHVRPDAIVGIPAAVIGGWLCGRGIAGIVGSLGADDAPASAVRMRAAVASVDGGAALVLTGAW